MLFRFTLQNDVLGSLVINEPDGWADCRLKLERDKNFHSLIEYFEGSFIFYGNNGVVDGGIDYIKEVEQTQGFDATIAVHIDLSVDGYTYYVLFSGQLNLALAQEMPDNKIQIPIVRDDFWSKFINRLDTPVDVQSDLSLDGDDADVFDSVNLRLTSQKIQKKHSVFLQDATVVYEDDWVAGQYLQIGFDAEELSEIDETFDIPTGVNPDVPVYILNADEAGDYAFDIRIETSTISYEVGGVGPPITNCTITRIIDSTETLLDFYIQKNDEAPILFTVTNAALILTQRSSWYTYAGTLTLNVGDVVRFYGSLLSPLDNGDIDNLWIWGVGNTATVQRVNILYSPGVPPECFASAPLDDEISPGGAPSDVTKPTYFEITAQTITPDSNAFSFLIHDLSGQICDRYTNTPRSFYSEHLGSDKTLYRQYEGDGCAWRYAAAKGLQIRQYSLLEKPFFLSFNQLWKGINPVLCLGLGYENVNDVQVIRIEEMEHFYDASTTSLDISNVREITRVYDQEVIFKTIKVGYSKWQSENISGIDDAQTKHVYATRFVKTGSELNIESDFIGASLAIETTRRTTRIKSADYKFDNDTFLIAINPEPIYVSTSPDVADYNPELDENFTTISNLLNPDTRYNSRITPARNLMRWIRYVSGSLQSYLDSKFKFVSGEGNYDMVSDMQNVSDGCDEVKREISEKEDLPVYDDPLHLALQYEIRVPLEWEDYLTIRENRKKAIGISQTTTGHVKFFIDTLEYELVKGIATIKAWPIEYFDIQVIDEVPAMRTCIPVTPDNCEDAYLTEDSFEFETEAGECLILN